MPDRLSALRAPQGELRLRILSAAVLAPVALAVELAGPVPFAVLVAAVAVLALREWTVLTGAAQAVLPSIAAVACLALGLLALAVGARDLAIGLLGAPPLLALAAGLRRGDLGWLGLGFLYVAVPSAGLILVRQAEPFGWAAVLFILFVVWATDIAAYFGGRSFGGPKLWPRVSPKKTWSGALSGLAAALIAGGLTAELTGMADWRMGLLVAAPLSIASQLGDLFESALKRRFGTKDSGRLIPGHGGVLDRLDGLFAAAALALLLAVAGLGGGIVVLPGLPAGQAGGAS